MNTNSNHDARAIILTLVFCSIQALLQSTRQDNFCVVTTIFAAMAVYSAPARGCRLHPPGPPPILLFAAIGTPAGADHTQHSVQSLTCLLVRPLQLLPSRSTILLRQSGIRILFISSPILHTCGKIGSTSNSVLKKREIYPLK